MKVQLAVLCEAANVSMDGKLNIFGEFNTINAAQLPAVYPVIVYVVKLVFRSEDVANDGTIPVHFRVEVRSPDGVIVSSIEGSGIGSGHEAGTPSSLPLILPVLNPTFDTYGEFEFRLFINHKEQNCISLLIRELVNQ